MGFRADRISYGRRSLFTELLAFYFLAGIAS